VKTSFFFLYSGILQGCSALQFRSGTGTSDRWRTVLEKEKMIPRFDAKAPPNFEYNPSDISRFSQGFLAVLG